MCSCPIFIKMHLLGEKYLRGIKKSTWNKSAHDAILLQWVHLKIYFLCTCQYSSTLGIVFRLRKFYFETVFTMSHAFRTKYLNLCTVWVQHSYLVHDPDDLAGDFSCIITWWVIEYLQSLCENDINLAL